MSMETWKEEFYPVEAGKVPVEDALEHSIRKWEGLQPDALKKHSVRIYGTRLMDEDADDDEHIGALHIDSLTCALCHHHFRNKPVTRCLDCELHRLLGSPCDRRIMSPYKQFARGDAAPMLAALIASRQFKTSVPKTDAPLHGSCTPAPQP